jgi:hypothetical protein
MADLTVISTQLISAAKGSIIFTHYPFQNQIYNIRYLICYPLLVNFTLGILHSDFAKTMAIEIGHNSRIAAARPC